MEYIFIYKGPYLGDDPNSSYTGNIRMSASGFPWALNYLPFGYWGAWYKLFINSGDFSLVANTTGFAIFKNKLYLGIIYSLPKGKYTIFNGNFVKYGTEIPLSGPWLGFNSILGKSFTVQILKNFTYVNSTNTPVSYGNIYMPVNLKPNTDYILEYNISGINVNNANVYIRFYSGENGSGKVLDTYGTSPVSGNITQMHIVWSFETPSNFSSAFLFPTLQKYENSNNSHVTFTFYPMIQLVQVVPSSVNYSLLTPTKIAITQAISNSILIFVSNYNSGWKMDVNGAYLNPSVFNMGMLNSTSFNINGSISSATVYFSPQTQYAEFLMIRLWTFLIISLVAILLWIYDKHRIVK